MGLSSAGLNVAANAWAAAADNCRLHTADPGAAGTSNVAASGPQTVSWNTAVAGDIDVASAINFTGGAASGACTHISFWDGTPGSSTFLGSFALTGDQTFNAAGEYTVDSGTIDFD